MPEGWTGTTEPEERRELPGGFPDTYPVPGSKTTDLAVARAFPYWREPTLPADWTLQYAERGGFRVSSYDGHCAHYVNAQGVGGVEICGDYAVYRYGPTEASWLARGGAGERRRGVYETRLIAGRPALVDYSPLGPHHDRAGAVRVWVYDPATESDYYIISGDGTLRGANVDAVLAIAASLFEKPPPLLYETYDLSGAVSEPGHYAFLADPNDPGSVVTTYEGLRDGTATALLIHTTDAHGISRTDLFDAVEAGDLVEWRQAPDCFARYQVTAVKPDPTGTVPRKLLGVAWMTYAYAGCRSGAIDTRRVATFDFGDLPLLGGTSLHTPIVHGIYQIYPEGAPEHESGFMQWAPSADWPQLTPGWRRDLASARQLAHWREPALPPGWTLSSAHVEQPEIARYGYTVDWVDPGPEGGPSLKLFVHSMPTTYRRLGDAAVWRPADNALGVIEAHVIAGRPAYVVRSAPPYDDLFNVAEVWIYDPATETEYVLVSYATTLAGPNYSILLSLAASLFEPPNPP